MTLPRRSLLGMLFVAVAAPFVWRSKSAEAARVITSEERSVNNPPNLNGHCIDKRTVEVFEDDDEKMVILVKNHYRPDGETDGRGLIWNEKVIILKDIRGNGTGEFTEGPEFLKARLEKIANGKAC